MVVGSIASSVIKGGAAAKAGRQQATAAQRAEAIAAQDKAEQTARMDQFIRPATSDWRVGDTGPITGSANLQSALTGAMGPEAQQQAYAQYQESPGVAWQRDQGMRGLDAEIAASGRGGGSRLRAVSEFNQGLAMQDFGNNFSRLSTVTNTGLSAAGTLGNQVIDFSKQGQQAVTQAGQAQAGATLGRAKAYASGIESLAKIYGSK